MPSIDRRRFLRLTGAALGLGSSLAGRAAPVLEGVRFDERITLGGRNLQLNGTGLRAAGWFKLYVAALYLPTPATTAEAALGQVGPKRVRVVMLREAPADELGKAVHKGVMRNVAASEQAALRERLARLVAMVNAVGEVKAGDTVDFDFDPTLGTILLLNGKTRGPAIAGADFEAALLRSFIGEHPYHRDLRAGLLGAAAKP